jgi:hypothetical protein
MVVATRGAKAIDSPSNHETASPRRAYALGIAQHLF